MKVKKLSITAVYKFLNKSTKKLRIKDCWSSRKWRDQEYGLRLAMCMVESWAVEVEAFVDPKNLIILLLHLIDVPMQNATALRFLTAQQRRVTITWRKEVLEASCLMLKEKSNVIHSFEANCIRIDQMLDIYCNNLFDNALIKC